MDRCAIDSSREHHLLNYLGNRSFHFSGGLFISQLVLVVVVDFRAGVKPLDSSLSKEELGKFVF